MLSVIVIQSHFVNVLIIIDLIKQTLILPVHIKSQLSYAAIAEKFCIRKLYNLWKNSKKARLKKSTRKMRMVSRSWQNCLEGSQNCSQGRGFCLLFLPRGRNFAKIFCPGTGNLATLKNSPGVSRGGGCWCLELTDALHWWNEKRVWAIRRVFSVIVRGIWHHFCPQKLNRVQFCAL